MDVPILVFTAIGTLCTIILVLPALGLDVRIFGREKPMNAAASKGRWWFVLFLALMSGASSGVGWYKYYHKPCPEYFMGYGPDGFGGVQLQVDTSWLSDDKGEKRLMAVGILFDRDKEQMEDTRIIKSRTYEIDLPAMNIYITPTKEFLATEANGQLMVVYLLEVPENFPTERLIKLSDVNALGGKILQSKGLRVALAATPPPR